MASFRYRAIAPGGTVVSGVMEASDQAVVIQRVRKLGQYPVSASLARSRSVSGIAGVLRSRTHASHRQLSVASQELATLLKAGIDLDRSLSILERLGDLGVLRSSFAAVRSKMRDGASFGDALESRPEFPTFFVSAVRAGESGGTLETTLAGVSEYLSRSVAIRDAITSALIYPIILLVTAGLSIVFILVFVIPQFEPLFAEAGRALPWPTRVVVALGDAVRGYWWLIATFAAAAAFGVRKALQNPEHRRSLDRYLLSLPVLGPLLVSIDVQRFSRTLGTLLSNGVPLPTALPLAREVIANRVLGDAISESAIALREGDALADHLERKGVFPEVTVDLIRVGEESGKLDEMLLRQADLDEHRIRHSIDRLLALLVPALTIGLGLLVGALIASLLSAILSVNDLALPQ